MSGRKLDAPLAVQAASLKKSMNNREKRRHSDRAQRARGSEDGAGPDRLAQRRFAGSSGARNDTGGVQLGSAAANISHAAVPEPRVLRCTLCQAAFKNVAEEQQHIAGPAHRKALARQQSEKEQKARLARGRDAADSAVAAAQWSAPAGRPSQPSLLTTR
ncbi:hypothetical protein ABBQ38_011591 [Trebouxia sp. C0009 RCD-2024]